MRYKLKRRIVERLRIIYKNGYTHEMWVYNLRVSKEGEYTWSHYNQGNRIIDLQPENIISIFVIKRKKVFYWSKKRVKRKRIALETFKPKQAVPLREKQDFNY